MIGSTEELIKALRNNNFWIYGAGYVANIFFNAIDRKGLCNNLLGFVVSSCQDEKNNGVKSIDRVDFNDSLICIAVHETVLAKIEAELNKRHLHNYVWIYPYLFELMLDKPLEDKKLVDIKTIYENNRENLIVPIRYLAIEEYYGKRSNGYDTYLKCMELSCNKETAVQRLEQFKHLIKSVEEGGFYEDSTITLLDNYKHIDGTHRLALAIFFDETKIACRIYPSRLAQTEIHGLGGVIKKEDIIKMIDDKSVIQDILDAQERINEKYK